VSLPQALLNLGNSLSLPILARLDPERAHQLTLKALASLPLPRAAPDDEALKITAFGLEFPNPLGLAAGADKNGEAADAFLQLGFGFTEVGTITPLPQAGNPRPRLFRLPRDKAVINRFGFNSQGHLAVHRRLARGQKNPGVIGINLGANKDSEDRIADYVRGVEAFADCASYFTINISSPNTPGLRDLQQDAALNDLLSREIFARDYVCPKTPLLLKIAPDLDLHELDQIIACARAKKIDGMIISNTTISRPEGVWDPRAKEAGGLSGRPLFLLSTQMLAQAYLRVENQFPLIGVGGIDSAATAFAKIEAGATLVQFYSAMVYRGLAPIKEIKRGLLRRLEQDSHFQLANAIGTKAEEWAKGETARDV
jgi:dihydroorotate dehydrogenase